MIFTWDDMELSEKLKIYDKGITLNDGPEGVYQLQVGYRAGDMWAPYLLIMSKRCRSRRSIFWNVSNAPILMNWHGQAGLRLSFAFEAASQSYGKMHGSCQSNSILEGVQA